MTATIKKGNALDSSTFTNMYTDKKIDPPGQTHLKSLA